MRRDETLAFLLKHKVVAVIRMADPEKLLRVVEAVERGGVRAVEITMTVPGAVDIIRGLADRKLPGIRLGAGTVLDAETAVAVIEAGADFVVSPVADPGMIRECRRCGVLVAPGAYTPAEIWRAWNDGADIVKVFPATSLGPSYFKDIKGPFPDVRLMPTGGVTPANAKSFLDAGACCVGIGTALLDGKLIAESRWDELTARAAGLVDALG
ncbi:MAG: bifunctional 4-hydroxy-2-oxoglutarate aldolase/2-dehydro-3-deoxy-phosphogluconate aldolase [Acidobacteriota bacterium]|nr:bifunctional 4-hydroxy-2-oxoglutarate aldolase/2-dehydro-3-deoxy-phosphogluconate aldolase [Acidobacteriota bacterium]